MGEGELMKIKNAEVWITINDTVPPTDGYGRAILLYAERWANAMEREIALGQSLEAVAAATSREADTDGITIAMYGAAVEVLAAVWEHGEVLRRWHNLDVQIGNEGERANASGGILNMAVINIGGDGA